MSRLWAAVAFALAASSCADRSPPPAWPDPDPPGMAQPLPDEQHEDAPDESEEPAPEELTPSASPQ